MKHKYSQKIFVELLFVARSMRIHSSFCSCFFTFHILTNLSNIKGTDQIKNVKPKFLCHSWAFYRVKKYHTCVTKKTYQLYDESNDCLFIFTKCFIIQRSIPQHHKSALRESFLHKISDEWESILKRQSQ